jgi:transcriptional regulator with XRE-family HTH domain
MKNIDILKAIKSKDFKMKSLRELRIEKGLSQLDLAVKSRIQTCHISQVETGAIKNMTYYTSKPLAEALDCDPLDLMLGQALANQGLELSQRKTAVKTVLENTDLMAASKSIDGIEKSDFGDRDSFGRKTIQKEVERDQAGIVRKEKEIKRDSFGRVIKNDN